VTREIKKIENLVRMERSGDGNQSEAREHQQTIKARVSSQEKLGRENRKIGYYTLKRR
jgi:predicted Rdx family selenoprotein